MVSRYFGSIEVVGDRINILKRKNKRLQSKQEVFILLQDKVRNSKIFESSLIQTKLLSKYFLSLQYELLCDYSFFVEVKSLSKDRCIYLAQNNNIVVTDTKDTFLKKYCLTWDKAVFRIVISLSELCFNSEELIGYYLDRDLRNQIRDVARKILEYADLHYSQGCHIKVVFPDTGLCNVFIDENAGQVYVDGTILFILSPIGFYIQ